MKKCLLFSALSVAACSVMAQPFIQSAENAPVAEMQAQDQITLEKLLKAESATVERTTEAGTFKSRAASDVTPYYYAPGGAFYRGWIAHPDYALNAAVVAKNELRVPSGAPLKWTNGSFASSSADFEGVTYNWQYVDINWDEMTFFAATSTETHLVTPAIPAGYTLASSPLLTVGERSFGANCQVKNVGGPYLGFNNIGLMPMNYFPFDIQMFANKEATAPNDSLDLSAYYNTSIGSNILTDGEVVKETGFMVAAPASIYGMTGVTFNGVISAYESPRIQFDVYRLEAYRGSDNNITLEKGERLGGGFLNKEDIPVKASGFVAFTIPVMEEKGVLKKKSFINIDDQVLIMFSGWEVKKEGSTYSGDLVRPIMVQVNNSAISQNSVGYYVNGNDQIVQWSKWRFGALEILSTPAFGVMLYNGNLALPDADENTYVYTAPEAGATYDFTFMPSTDLTDAMVKISGNGLYDWYDYEVGAFNETTGEQVIKVTVDPLSGTAGRYSLMKVSIPGAEQVVTIKQGQLSGIGSVEADADVVASEYFDLMGRKLNAEPESGLFIRKDLKADGTTVATKVAK